LPYWGAGGLRAALTYTPEEERGHANDYDQPDPYNADEQIAPAGVGHDSLPDSQWIRRNTTANLGNNELAPVNEFVPVKRPIRYSVETSIFLLRGSLASRHRLKADGYIARSPQSGLLLLSVSRSFSTNG
jgi:hypothetical protein